MWTFAITWRPSSVNFSPLIGTSHQVSVHLAEQLQRRRFLEISQSEKKFAYGGNVC
jgi:hypothetical protein